VHKQPLRKVPLASPSAATAPAAATPSAAPAAGLCRLHPRRLARGAAECPFDGHEPAAVCAEAEAGGLCWRGGEVVGQRLAREEGA